MFLLLLSSCNNKRRGKSPILPEATGAPWDLLVVMDNDVWRNTEAGRALYDVLNTGIYGLPQNEPFFKISRTDEKNFTGILMPVKNIIITEISSKMYTKAKYVYSKDIWATNQSVMKIHAPDNKSFAEFVKNHADEIRSFFVKAGRDRYLSYMKTKRNRTMSKMVKAKFGFDFWVPDQMSLCNNSKENFFWASNSSSMKRKSIVVYSYPYTSTEQLKLNNLVSARDSVMKENIPGSTIGSYMTTSKALLPSYSEMNIDGDYAVEMRGLWEVTGDVMGGPFVSLTRIDKQKGMIVTVETFIFAPNSKKRDLIRFMEASLYSLKFEQKEKQNDK